MQREMQLARSAYIFAYKLALQPEILCNHMTIHWRVPVSRIDTCFGCIYLWNTRITYGMLCGRE